MMQFQTLGFLVQRSVGDQVTAPSNSFVCQSWASQSLPTDTPLPNKWTYKLNKIMCVKQTKLQNKFHILFSSWIAGSGPPNQKFRGHWCEPHITWTVSHPDLRHLSPSICTLVHPFSFLDSLKCPVQCSKSLDYLTKWVNTIQVKHILQCWRSKKYPGKVKHYYNLTLISVFPFNYLSIPRHSKKHLGNKDMICFLDFSRISEWATGASPEIRNQRVEFFSVRV